MGFADIKFGPDMAPLNRFLTGVLAAKAAERQRILDRYRIIAEMRRAGYEPKDMEQIATLDPRDWKWKKASDLDKEFGRAYAGAFGKALAQEQFAKPLEERAAEARALEAAKYEGRYPWQERLESYRSDLRMGEMGQQHTYNVMRDLNRHQQELERIDFAKALSHANAMKELRTRQHFQAAQDAMRAVRGAWNKLYDQLIRINEQEMLFGKDRTRAAKLAELKTGVLDKFDKQMRQSLDAVVQNYIQADFKPPLDVMSMFVALHYNDPDIVTDLMSLYGDEGTVRTILQRASDYMQTMLPRRPE